MTYTEETEEELFKKISNPTTVDVSSHFDAGKIEELEKLVADQIELEDGEYAVLCVGMVYPEDTDQ